MQTSPSASSTPSPSLSIHDPNSKPEFDPELLLSHKFADWLFRYSARDVALYNLSIGACGDFATYTKELKYVYHEQGQQLIEVLPTFAALLTVRVYPIVAKMPGMQGFEKQIQHEGHWYIEPYRPIPSIATLRNTITISALHDKGTDALLEIENKSFNEASGELLFMNRFSLTILGAGGFSKSSEPYSFYAYPDHPSYLDINIPDWDPFCTFEDRTQPSQALLYRLSGDYNPLYADPAVAEAEGFVGPILHELCTLGFAVRAIITRGCLKHDSLIRNISGQAISPVYPGETLITELWCIDTRYRCNFGDGTQKFRVFLFCFRELVVSQNHLHLIHTMITIPHHRASSENSEQFVVNQPLFIYEDRTQRSQALLHRLSADYYHLHAESVRYSRRILHEVCTIGFAVRAIIKKICVGFPNKIRNIYGLTSGSLPVSTF